MRLLAIVVVIAGCQRAPMTLLDRETDEARRLYPDLASLYTGDQGIYRGCGPNSGVCHNASEFPNMFTLGSILDNIGQPCNQKRTSADAMADLCEPVGDTFASNGQTSELAWIVPATDATGVIDPRRWLVGLRQPIESPASQMLISRGDTPLWHLERYSTGHVTDDPSVIEIDALPVNADGSDPATALDQAFSTAGIPAMPDAVRVGDPNRNGIYGASLDGRLIKPGRPDQSYLLQRLTDPTAGPLMPRANCCFWTLAAVRAMWCWVGGLRADGSNAMDPINYDDCSSSPPVDLLYPQPGPSCETSGMCPASVAIADAARFPALYTTVFTAQCSGSVCHDRGDVAGVDLSSQDRAYMSLLTKIVPGNPDGSVLWQRITPGSCTGTCEPMPLGREPIPDDQRQLIREWITAGAPPE